MCLTRGDADERATAGGDASAVRGSTVTSIVLSLVVVVGVVTAWRGRRPRPTNAVEQRIVAPAGRLVRRTLQAIGAALAAGTLLLLFGQQASAQSEPPAEPPATAAPVPDDPGAQDRLPEAPATAPSATPTVAAPDPPVVEVAPPSGPEPPPPSATAPTAAPSSPTPPVAAPAPTPTVTPPSPPPAPPAAPVVATTTWSIALSGRATIGSDGSTVWLSRAGVADEWRSASEILDILVSGGDTDDELVLGGTIGRRISFRGGGGRDGLVMPAQGATARVTGQGAGEIVDGGGDLLVSFAEVEDLVGGPGGRHVPRRRAGRPGLVDDGTDRPPGRRGRGRAQRR